MSKIIISTNTTLDGMVQDPDGAEGSAQGGWFTRMGGDREAWAEIETDEAMRADALLFGRRSYQWFATRWSTREGAWADRLRVLPKYVVSSTLTEAAATWGPTTILGADLASQITDVKHEHDGDIVVYASYQLGHELLRHDLVDELRLFVHPFVLGSGRRLFGETDATKPMRLVAAATVGEGLALLTYEPVRGASS